MKHQAPYLWTLSLLVCLLGCTPRPSAPAIQSQTSAGFHDNREGLRFAVPPTWIQTTVSRLPQRLEDELILVQYKMKTPGKSASLEILCFDEQEETDPFRYHLGESHSVMDWKSVSDPEEVQSTGKTGRRFVYTGHLSGEEMTKEVVVYRRELGHGGARVYSFIGLFYTTDDKAREQIRQMIRSVIWR